MTERFPNDRYEWEYNDGETDTYGKVWANDRQEAIERIKKVLETDDLEFDRSAVTLEMNISSDPSDYEQYDWKYDDGVTEYSGMVSASSEQRAIEQIREVVTTEHSVDFERSSVILE